MFRVIVKLQGPFLVEVQSSGDALTLSSSILWYNEEFIMDSMMMSFPSPDAAKQFQTISFPPPCFIVGSSGSVQSLVYTKLVFGYAAK